jgi:prefoldin subunit 5
MKPTRKKSFLSRCDDALWSGAGLLHLVQLFLLLAVLAFGVLAYIKTRTYDSASRSDKAVGDLPTNGYEASWATDEIETPDLRELKTDLGKKINDALSDSEGRVGKRLEDLVEQISEQRDKANKHSDLAVSRFENKLKEVELLLEKKDGKINKNAELHNQVLQEIQEVQNLLKPIEAFQSIEVGLGKKLDTVVEGIEKVSKLLNDNRKHSDSQGDNSPLLDKKFEAKVEDRLRDFRENLEDIDSQLIKYGQETEAWRQQLQRYAESSLASQYSVLLLCDSESFRDVRKLASYFDPQKLQHPLQFKNYDFDVKVARGGAVFSADREFEGEVNPLNLDALVTPDSQAQKTCLADLFGASQKSGEAVKERLVMVAEGNAVRTPPPAFSEWCESHDIEVDLVLFMQDPLVPNENLKKWARFCQKTDGQLISVYPSNKVGKDTENVGFSKDKLRIFQAVQRVLYPVVGPSQ